MSSIWISFGEALASTQQNRRHLLLGNGFSISIHQRFSYHSLFDEAVIRDQSLSNLFEGCGVDFEAALARARRPEDQEKLRDCFIDAVARVHPTRKLLPPKAREACGQFLEAFAGVARQNIRGRVFTTNYDLMLYWVLMQRQVALKMYDGFDRDAIWDAARTWSTFVFYLHGALHHYEIPLGRIKPKMQQRKLMWREDAVIIKQVRLNLEKGRFPVFVSEGTSAEKQSRIRRNPYLRQAMKTFRNCCDDQEAALFIVGHSLAAVDAHITDVIGAGRSSVYIGVFSEADKRRALQLIGIWNSQRDRANQIPLRVRLFKTKECATWEPTEYDPSKPHQTS